MRTADSGIPINPIAGMYVPEDGWASSEDFFQSVDEAGLGWVSLALDENGNLTIVEEYDSYDDIPLNQGARSPLLIKVLLIIGRTVVLTLMCKFLNGVIIEVTGNSASGWFEYAKTRLLGKPAPPNNRLVLPCSVYPPHSGEYHRCMNA